MKINYINTFYMKDRTQSNKYCCFIGIVMQVCCSAMILQMSACTKFVEVDPPVTQLVKETVYNSNATAGAAVTGIYQTMVDNTVGGNANGISALLGLSADEFSLYPNQDQVLNETFSNAISGNTSILIWNQLYNCIYQSNLAIEGLTSSNGVSAPLKAQLIGETKFIRAFCYFYLTNIYGDVPLVLETSYEANQMLKRSSKDAIVSQIITDLKEAQTLLSDNYVRPDGSISTDRVRPNKGAATGLLARVYLFGGQWTEAELESTKVIENTDAYNLVDDLSQVFLKDNREAIWQLEPPNTGFNAPDAVFILGLLYNGGPASYAPFLLNESFVSSFEDGDLRKAQWVTSSTTGTTTYYYPYKYQLYYTGESPKEYPVLLRLAEQYLIRAEARAHQGKVTGAQADINRIRQRAGLPFTQVTGEDELLNAVRSERRCELFTEYGHRWLDLKRTNQIDNVMSVATSQKGGVWKSTAQLFPIPVNEILTNPNLTQNPGY